MAWINEIEEQDADGELRTVYDELLKSRGKLANILQVQSLNPGALKTHVDLYMHLMFARSGLSRKEREAIAVVVSANNECSYCVNHHYEPLARYEKNAQVLAKIRNAEALDTLDARLAGMLKHAEKLTTNPHQVSADDVQKLRDLGLSDSDILDITLVTAYFNFVNRIALGLGVAYSEEEIQGYES
ncbi:MAG: peroxidase-related enzyme [Proteobacteria bacterium]|nr:peroxidase-related enzyme [Pseudomonadota bacterium]